MVSSAELRDNAESLQKPVVEVRGLTVGINVGIDPKLKLSI